MRLQALATPSRPPRARRGDGLRSARIRERIEQLLARERDAIGPSWLSRFPLQHYVQWFSSPETEGNYARFPGELRPWFESIAAAAGDDVLSAYHRLAMLWLMRASLERIANGQVVLAEGFDEPLVAWFDGLLDRLDAEPGLRCDAADDLFAKDISLCALRLLPTHGPCHLEIAWLGRGFLFTGGLRQLLPALRCYVLDLRLETRKLCTLHVEDRVVFRSFTEAGWQRSYADVAAYMRRRPGIVALHAASWFWDPKVKEISPKMGYLHDVPKRGGARFFKLGADAAARKNALTNAKRRRLYEAGEYVPTTYLMIWPRTRLLASV